MKKLLRIMRRVQIAGIGAVLIMSVYLAQQHSVPAVAGTNQKIYSSHMILVDLNQRKVLSESGSQEQIYPASLTKIMTALVSIERLEAMDGIDVMMEIPENIFTDLYRQNASMAGFEPGEKVTAKDLLYGMLLPSGADAAIAMAENLWGSEEVMVYKMNARAQSLGMDDTHFVNATGLHDDDHYSTLEDLSLLLEEALDHETFRKIFTASVYETTKSVQHPQGILLQSTLFEKMSIRAMENLTILGGKTGFTDRAGLCLATLAAMDGHEYLLITAGAKSNTSSNPLHILDAIKIYSTLI